MSEDTAILDDIIELYSIGYDTEALNYTNEYLTSYYKNVVYDGNTFVATPIERSGVSFADNLELTKMTFSLPATSNTAGNFIIRSANTKTFIRVERRYLNDATIKVLLIDGFISNMTFSSGIITFEISSVMSDLTKNIPRLRFQNLCNNLLFDLGCGLNAEDFKTVKAFIPDSTGYILTANGGSTGNPSRYFTNGKAFLKDTGEWRFIEKHELVGGVDVLHISFPFTTDSTVFSLNVYPGCNKTPDQTYDGTNQLLGCLNCCGLAKDDTNTYRGFDNIVSFLGFPYIPTKNSTESTVTLSG
jgi:hypothetical protein